MLSRRDSSGAEGCVDLSAVSMDCRLLREESIALVAFCVDRLADRRGKGPLCAD